MAVFFIVPGTTSALNSATTDSTAMPYFWEVRRDGALLAHGDEESPLGGWLVRGLAPSPTAADTSLVEITVPSTALPVAGYAARVHYGGDVYLLDFCLTPEEDALTLTATPDEGGEIALAWSAVTDFVRYQVFQYPTYSDAVSRTNGTVLATINAGDTPPTNEYIHIDGSHSGALQHFRVAHAFNSSGPNGNWSNVASASPHNTAPDVASDLTLTTVDAPTRAYTLDWTDANKPFDFDSYWFVARRTNGNPLEERVNVGSADTYDFTAHWGDWEYSVAIRDVAGAETPEDLLFPTGLTTSHDRTTPPPTPDQPTAVAGDTKVVVSWPDPNDPDLAIVGYRIYVDGNSSYTVEVTDLTWTHAGLTNGVAHTYRVSAVDIWGNESTKSPASDPATPADVTPPPAPLFLTATAQEVSGAAQVLLRWRKSTDASASDTAKFKVYTVTGAVGSEVYTAVPGGETGNGTTYAITLTGLTAGQTYRYVVTAFDELAANNESGYSNEASIVARATTPTLPTLVLDTASAANVALNGSATVAFVPPAGGSGLVKYVAHTFSTPYYLPLATTFETVGDDLLVTASGLPNGSATTLYILGYNSDGFATAFVSKTVTPTDTLAPLPPTAFAVTAVGDGSVTLGWTASPSADLGGYRLQRYTKHADGTYAASGSPTSLLSSAVSATVSGLANGVTVYFALAAVDTRPATPNVSAYTAILAATPRDATIPDAPSGAPVVTAGVGRVFVTLPPLDPEPADTALYRLFRDTSTLVREVSRADVAAETVFEDASVVVGTAYTYRYAAVDTSGNQSPLSPASASVTALAPSPAPAWDNTTETNCERVRLRVRGEFINDGQRYFTGKVNVSPSPDSNFVDLRFGFDLVDVETRDSLTVKNVESLILSNSPTFDSGATYELTVIPYSASQVRVVTLNRAFFEDPDSEPDIEQGRSLEDAPEAGPAGTFVIRDWPLGGNGGGKTTVYYKARVSCVENDQIGLFPFGYQPLASILWEREAPVCPGVPAADDGADPDLWYTGRRTTWRFDGVTESASGAGRSGVRSYLGALLEIADDDLKSTLGTTLNGLRSVAPTVPAASLAADGFTYDVSLGTYTADAGVLLNTALTVSAASGVALATHAGLTVGATKPDGAVEARYTVPTPPGGSGADLRLFLRAAVAATDPFDPEGADAIELEVRAHSATACEARLRRTTGGTVLLGREQIVPLPAWAWTKLIAGGSLELYFSTNGDTRPLYAEAYFTPSDRSETLLLGSATLPAFEGDGPWDVRGEFAAHAAAGTGSPTVRCNELVLAGGVCHIGIDLGDADLDGGTPLGYPSAGTQPLSVGGAGWVADLGANAVWSSLADATLATGETAPSATATVEQVTLAAPVTAAGRSAFEMLAVRPSFSAHTLLRWKMKSVTGEFYVALTPSPALHAYEDGAATVALCRRGDGDAGAPTLPYNTPTLIVVFSATQRRVFALLRAQDGTLSEYTLGAFTSPSAFEEWSVETNTVNAFGVAQQTVLVLRRGGVNAGGEFRLPLLPAAVRGEGLYAAFGVRSDGVGTPRLGASRVAGGAVVSSFSFYGLPTFEPLEAGEAPRTRHFTRGTLGSVTEPSLLGQNGIASQSDRAGWPYVAADNAPKLFFSEVHFGSVGPVYGSVGVGLVELRMRRRGLLSAPGVPRLRFYSGIAGGQVEGPLTPWISARATKAGDLTPLGGAAPYNEIVQFDVKDFAAVAATEGETLVMVVELPAACELAGVAEKDVCQEALSLRLTPDEMVGGASATYASRADALWYRLFESYESRYDNPRDGAFVQLRVRAQSHAGLVSAASPLSRTLRVDLVPPQDEGYGGRPRLELPYRAAVRAATVEIHAQDAKSGVLAFRVLRESDAGAITSTPWLPWGAFAADGPSNAVQYTVYLYGGAVAGAPNASFDGPRKLWAQVMDRVGNVAETRPVSVFAQCAVLVDTLPPSGSADWADPYTGEVPAFTNTDEGHIRLNGFDAVSGVKDARLRAIGSFVWKDWALLSSYRRVTFDDLFGAGHADGLARVEVQFRDWGGTAQQPSGLWDVLSRGVAAGLLFTAATTWQAPADAAVCLYLGAIRTQRFEGMGLVRDTSPDAVDERYVVRSEEVGSYGRSVALRATDFTTVTVNGDVWEYWDGSGSEPVDDHYHIDAASGTIIFDSALPTAPDLSIDVRRESAQLYRWDGAALTRVADLGGRGERAILSLLGIDGSLLAGGGSGNLWRSDGINVFGPIFTATDPTTEENLPITVLFAHEFDGEARGAQGPFVYLGTAGKPRLFRASLTVADQGDQWSFVSGYEALLPSDASFLCAASAYDRLWLGTSAGSILSYGRTPIYSNVANLADAWRRYDLALPPYDGDPTGLRPVQSLLPSGGEVYAGIGDRPELWRFSLQHRPLPRQSERWVSFNFGSAFSANPAPWQFYTSTQTYMDGSNPNIGQLYDNRIGQFTGYTVSGASGLLSAVSITDPRSASGFREMVALRGDAGKMSVFVAGDGSDWPDVIEGQDNWMLELEMMQIANSGTGRQGFTVSDGRYYFEVSLGAGDVTLQSGGRTATASFWSDGFSLMSVGDTGIGLVPPSVYPNRAPTVIWNFPGSTDEIEVKGGPYYDGTTTAVTTGDAQGWLAGGSVTPPAGTNLAGTVGSTLYTAGQRTSFDTYVTYLKVQPTPSGNPRIVKGASGSTVQVFSQGDVTILAADVDTAATLPVEVDRGSKLYVRCRVRPLIGSDLRDAKIRATWSYTDSVYLDECQWVEAPLSQEWHAASTDSAGFMDANPYTYVLEPSWAGEVRTLAIEWVGLPEGVTRADIEVEFIAIASDFAVPNIQARLTPVRLGVSGKRVKVWVGEHVDPLIDEEDFLSLPVSDSEYEIRIGKIDPEESGSVWGYGTLRFLAGAVVAPVEAVETGWQRAARLPSAGGVRKLVHYLGTAYAITDGLGYVRRADDPSERAVKLFAHAPDREIWEKKAPAAPIDQDGIGCVRALAAAVYKDELIVAGQQGEVRWGAPV